MLKFLLTLFKQVPIIIITNNIETEVNLGGKLNNFLKSTSKILHIWNIIPFENQKTSINKRTDLQITQIL